MRTGTLEMAMPAVSFDLVKPAARVLAGNQVENRPDAGSRGWIDALRDSGERREEAVARLHALLLRAARFEVARRRATLPHLRGDDFDDLAMQSADDALVALLSKVDSYRGESRFTTWAYKFALLEAAVKLRRRAWQGREVPLEPDLWRLFEAEGTSPESGVEHSELFQEIQRAIAHELTPHQREVLVATTLNDVPIDVLAERLKMTRGALYKTLHDARQKLRAHLARQGMALDEEGKEGR
jgi:RNA polymerase sigma-70 factor (ECF subfamily)